MISKNPNIFPVTENGFALPNGGGSLGIIAMSVDFEDTTEKTGPKIPENAVPVWMYVSITQDFNDSTGDTLDIGYTGDSTYFASAVDISTQLNLDAGVTGFAVGVYGVKIVDVPNLVATYTEATGDASQGSANIFLVYYLAGEVVNIE